jgi:hypothetical protein
MIVIKRVDGAIRGMVWLLRCRHRIVSEARRATFLSRCDMNFQTLTVTALVAGFFAAGVVAQTPRHSRLRHRLLPLPPGVRP